jgi:hypothetical protein
MIFLISSSWVARIVGMSHQHLVNSNFVILFYFHFLSFGSTGVWTKGLSL